MPTDAPINFRNRYDQPVEQAYVNALLGRARYSVVANIIGFAVLLFLNAAAGLGAAMYAAIGARGVAIAVTAYNSATLSAALERGTDVTTQINRLSAGLFLAGITWGALLLAVPPEQITSLEGLAVVTIVCIGIALVVATAAPVPRAFIAFLSGFSIAIVIWTFAMDLGPSAMVGILLFAVAVLSFGYGMMREAQGSGRLLVENGDLAERLERANSALQELLEQKDRLARTDLLTGLPNRRAIESDIASLGAKAAGTWSILLIDIDHFKRVNDRAGHAGGDEVLAATGALLRDFADTAKRDLRVARFGGEEFLMLAHDHDDAQVADLALALLAQFRLIRAPRGHDRTITASIGTARWSGSETFERALKRADDALYAAKAAGRNRVVAASPDLKLFDRLGA